MWLESSWALNVRLGMEACCTLCGTEAGADMLDGLQINGERFGKLYVEKAQLDPGSVAFYSGTDEKAHEMEARMWIEAVINDTSPIVLPEQALVVTEILEAIYTSSATGQPFYFEPKPGGNGRKTVKKSVLAGVK